MAWDRKCFTARYAGKCHTCGKQYGPGETISLVVQGSSRGYRGGNKYAHILCAQGASKPFEPYIPPATIEPEPEPDKPAGQSVQEPKPELGQKGAEVQDKLADLIAEAVAARIKPALDEERVKAIVDECAEKFRPSIKVIEVTIPGVEEPRKIEGAHYLMPRLLKLMGAGLPIYLWGPAGSGKSTAALQAAQALGRTHELDTLDPSTFRSMVQGYCTPIGDPVHTSFTRAWTAGSVYIAEECDNAPGHVQTLFNTALANGHAPLAWGNAPKKDGFVFVANGNTPGRPTAEFPDRRPMSAAFRDRLYFVHWPIDPAIECRAAGLQAPNAPRRTEKTCTPAEWVQWVQNVRAYCVAEVPTITVTPRASLDGLRALAAGETPLEVAHGLVFRGADQGLVDKVLGKVGLP